MESINNHNMRTKYFIAMKLTALEQEFYKLWKCELLKTFFFFFFLNLSCRLLFDTHKERILVKDQIAKTTPYREMRKLVNLFCVMLIHLNLSQYCVF